MSTGIIGEKADLSLTEEIIHYVSTYKPKLCILTPCYGGTCYVNYMTSLLKTAEVFRQFQFDLSIQFCKNDSLVSRARNNLIAKAMSDPAVTHVLFIDSDITWNPYDIFKLVIANKPIIGGVYPLKKYFWDKILPSQQSEEKSKTEENSKVDEILQRKRNSMLNYMSDEDFLQQNLLKYNINYKSNELSIQANVMEVRHLATGFMMIQRSVLESMMVQYPDTKYTDDVSFLEPHENKYAYALFDCRVKYGHYLSEDWYFCELWMNMGGKIYVDVSIPLTHTGPEDFSGFYLSSIV